MSAPTTNAPLTLLFLNIGRRVELVRCFREAFDRLSIAGRIITTDITWLNPAYFMGDARYFLPPSERDETDFIEKLEHICQSEKVSLIVPIIDLDLYCLAKYRERLRSIGTEVLVSAPEVIEICRDKYKFHQFLNANGFPAPKVFTPDEARVNALPLFIKPRSGGGSIHAHKLETDEDLEYYLYKISDPIIEEFLEGYEVTVDVFSDWSGTPVLALPRRRFKLKAGEVSIGAIERDVALEKQCIAIASTLGTIGPINIQVFVTSKGLFFTELNPRLAGGVTLSIAAGAPIPEWIVRMALEEPIQNVPVAIKNDLILMRYDDAFYFTPDQVRQ